MFATATDLMWLVLEESGGKDPLIVAQAMDLLIDAGEETLARSIEWMVKNDKVPVRMKSVKLFTYRISPKTSTAYPNVCVSKDIFLNLPMDDWLEVCPNKHEYNGPVSAKDCADAEVDFVYKSFERAVRAISEALVKSGVIEDGE